MTQGYCMRCKKTVEMLNPVKTKTKKGTTMYKGKCKCGTVVCRIGGD